MIARNKFKQKFKEKKMGNTVNGFENIQRAIDLLNQADQLNNGNQTASTTANTTPQNTGVSGDSFQNMLDTMARMFGGNQPTTNTTSPTQDTVDTKPAVQPKKKKKRGFFSKLKSGIGKAFKKIGGFLKKALPIISLAANFIPGVGPLVSMGLKIASAAMSAYNGIKSGNIMGAITGIAGAFTGGAGGLLSKAQSFLGNTGIGGLVSKGIDLFSKGKEWLSNATAGLGGKVTDWLTNKGPEILKNYAGNIGSSVTNWLNNKASDLFSRITNNPTVQKVTNFLNSGIGKSILDILTGKNA
jgi:hypothetical protein